MVTLSIGGEVVVEEQACMYVGEKGEMEGEKRWMMHTPTPASSIPVTESCHDARYISIDFQLFMFLEIKNLKVERRLGGRKKKKKKREDAE